MKKEKKKSSCAVVVKTKPEDYQKENLKVSDRPKSVNSVVRVPQLSSSRISFRSKQFPRARAGTHYDGRFNKRRSPDGDVHSNSKRRVVFSPPHGERGVWRPFFDWRFLPPPPPLPRHFFEGPSRPMPGWRW